MSGSYEDVDARAAGYRADALAMVPKGDDPLAGVIFALLAIEARLEALEFDISHVAGAVDGR